MAKTALCFIAAIISLSMSPGSADAEKIDELLKTIATEISGNRARDYTMRLWQYDKWSTLPMWKKSSEEARKIMLERGFDEAELVDTPADGVTTFGTWINPLGWDATDATLEVIEPANLPDEYRYLCNYRDNPTSLGCWSAPTPPEGIETELVLLEQPTGEELSKLDARGKIILVSGRSRALKRYLEPNGIIGIVSDEIEEHSNETITANDWQNGWSDLPGGWLMTDSDGKNDIRFSISLKKGNYLRDLLRRGIKVKVRAKIDARYYTDDTLPYTTGCIYGSGSEGEEVLVGGHNHEWGSSDNAAGVASYLEAVGTLNDLIKSGVLPRPRRSIRVMVGSEIHGALAYAEHNIEKLRKKTIVYLNLDDGGINYDYLSSILVFVMNPNSCPSYTDAFFADVAQRYYSAYAPFRILKTRSYSNADNLFCDPSIGVPSNWINMKNGGDLHHNSKDTIEKIDPRSLKEISVIAAVFLYYLADADYDDISFLAGLAFDRGMEIVLDKSSEMNDRLMNAKTGTEIGDILYDGIKNIKYYSELQQKVLYSIERVIPGDKKAQAHKYLSQYAGKIDEFGKLLVKQFSDAAKEKAKAESVKIVKYVKKEGPWENEASVIKPKRNYIGVISLAGIPAEEWKEVRSDPHWWSARNWASASVWWCDGKRNLNEIKELCELEAGVPVRNFDLINYYKFLEKFNLVEFVE